MQETQLVERCNGTDHTSQRYFLLLETNTRSFAFACYTKLYEVNVNFISNFCKIEWKISDDRVRISRATSVHLVLFSFYSFRIAFSRKSYSETIKVIV